jgi:hypothetical protein
MENLMLTGEALKGLANRITEIGLLVNPATVVFASLVAFAAYILISGIFFSPTRHLPGPLLARFTDLHFFYRILHGSLGSDLVKLHAKYGIGPRSILVDLRVRPRYSAWTQSGGRTAP